MSKKLYERPRIFDGWRIGDRYERSKGKIRVNNLEVVEDDEGNEILDVYDSGRSHQAMSRGRGEKILGAYLAPLHRYLESQVNRPWNKVYSDIRENVRGDGAAQLHILQCMESYVCGCDGENKKVLIEIEKDGRIYIHVLYANQNMELKKGDLFVHPRTGILSRYKRVPKSRYYHLTEDDVKKINHKTYFCKFYGIWHEVVYEKTPVMNSISSCFNSTRAFGHPGNFRWNCTTPKYTIRQVPKRILEQEGLKNDTT